MPQMNLANIKAVIFDMDGLMFNTEDIYRMAIIKMGESRGKEFKDEIHQKMMGKAAYEDVRVLIDEWGLDETAEDLFKEREKNFQDFFEIRIKAEKGLFELIDAINSHGLRKVIVTGSVMNIAKMSL